MSNIKVFDNDVLGLQVRTMLNEDGSISVNAEDTAIGYGWTQEKNGKIYPKWERLNGYCKDLGFSPEVGKDDYIPEGLFYLLGMKASNEAAQEFQKWLALDVLPTLRRTGSYTVHHKQDYSYPFVKDVQVKFYNGMPVLTLDDLCRLFGCHKSVISNKMYQCCWTGIHRYVLRGYELAEFKRRYKQYQGVSQLTVINQEGVDRLNFTGRPVDLLQLECCDEEVEMTSSSLQTINITININGQEKDILKQINERINCMLGN